MKRKKEMINPALTIKYLKAAEDITAQESMKNLVNAFIGAIDKLLPGVSVCLYESSVKPDSSVSVSPLYKGCASSEAQIIKIHTKFAGLPSDKAERQSMISSVNNDLPGNKEVYQIDLRENLKHYLIVATSTLDENQRELVSIVTSIYKNQLTILRKSKHDALTEMLNRDSFDFALIKTIKNIPKKKRLDKREGDKGDSHCLALIDIDNFKRVNDQFGHQAGDKVLVLVAQLIKESFRGEDAAFRYGGEEFAIIIRGSTLKQSKIALERFRLNFSKFTFPGVGFKTLSIGLTELAHSCDPSSAISRADQALYFAKNKGRNQTWTHEELTKKSLLSKNKENIAYLQDSNKG